MREIIFKNLTSQDKKKRNLTMCEVFEKNGIVTKIEKQSDYSITSEVKIRNSIDLRKLTPPDNDEQNLKHFYIFKKQNSQTGEEEFIYKITGKLYAIIKNNIFFIDYTHSFRIIFFHILNRMSNKKE